MTDVSLVSSAHPDFPASESNGAMHDAVHTPCDPFAELAALLVENDFMRSELDDQSLRAAREAESRAMAAEVRAMHDAADAIFTRACVQGGTAFAAGGAQVYGSLGQIGNTPPALSASDDERSCFNDCKFRNEGIEKGGGALGNVAEPLGDLAGGVTKAHADADAAEARNLAEQAGFEASEIREHRERVEKHTESVLELVESTLDSAHQGNLAILAKF